MAKEENDILTEEIIFIVLNLIFFISLLLFIMNSKNNISFYEETYCKEIALLIDAAKPNTTITIDVTKLKKIADKENRKLEDVIKIDNKNKKVIIKFKHSSGYSINFFTNYNVEKEINENEMKLIIK